MHPFPVGKKVMTNDEYFNTFGRRVIGTSIAFKEILPKAVTLVRWEHQEGKIIPDHQGNVVLMMTKDLENYLPN
jgi:hypothetical protein